MLPNLFKLKSENKKIGFTCSTFDFLHAGAVLMLQESKANCDYLVVGLQVDPSIDRKEKNSPVMSLVERYIKLSSMIGVVDLIIPYQTEKDLYDLLVSIPVDIRFVGEEYKDKVFTGSDLPIQIFYNTRRHSWSSTNVRKAVTEKTTKETIPPGREKV